MIYLPTFRPDNLNSPYSFLSRGRCRPESLVGGKYTKAKPWYMPHRSLTRR